MNLTDKVFNGENIAEAIVEREFPKEVIKDTLQTIQEDTLDLTEEMLDIEWQWQDFESDNHRINTQIKTSSLKESSENRISTYPGFEIYGVLFEHDRHVLQDLIAQMKIEIKQKGFNYMQAIEYVCSSIQYIPYTLILGSDGKCPCEMSFGSFSGNCTVQSDGRGCCSGIVPFGVYSPVEFVYYKTADCDTRALLAFTFLKEMGFDVAVMVSNNEGHSVLGISSTLANNYSYGENNRGKKFILWELTSPYWRLGMPVEGNDWYAALE